jgi:peptidoglycan/xylan/chitin deacetylase (PgdA/CDA1 family)
MKNSIINSFLIVMLVFSACTEKQNRIGETVITNWYQNKKGAISITYDDATINQFRKALPIMDSLGFKGTFFINTADIPESKFAPQLIGRPLREIIQETATIPTTENNLFERGSALRFLDIDSAIEKHNDAGALYERGKVNEAIAIINEAFEKVRKKKSTKAVRPRLLTGEVITWKEIKTFAENGHEFGNHTISHPRLAILDEPNLLYELEKCKEEIFYQLGAKHIFSAECPFGTENERVMQYAYKIHPALRNRMPETYLEEINRSSKLTPAASSKQYTQWQRGPLQKTTVAEMKSWVDTLMVYDNVWLVLTFHGVDGIGWEAKPSSDLKAYFQYMKEKENDVWVATFGDATKYMREKMDSKIDVTNANDTVTLKLHHSLDPANYTHPLTLKTIVPNEWRTVSVKQGEILTNATVSHENGRSYAIFNALPNKEEIEIFHGSN